MATHVSLEERTVGYILRASHSLGIEPETAVFLDKKEDVTVIRAYLKEKIKRNEPHLVDVLRRNSFLDMNNFFSAKKVLERAAASGYDIRRALVSIIEDPHNMGTYRYFITEEGPHQPQSFIFLSRIRKNFRNSRGCG